MKKSNNTYYKRIFRLLLVFLSLPIIWIFLYSNNEGWGTDANPNMRNCIIEFILFMLPLIGLLISIILFTIDFWKNKSIEKRINSACFLVVCLFMVINVIQKHIISYHSKDIIYNNRCSYITPDFATKLPFLSMRGFILSIILCIGSYFCFSNVKGKNIRIKVLMIILGILLLIPGLYFLNNSFYKY